jgi:hypothetical protein
MSNPDLYRHNVQLLLDISPPIEAFGIGGSGGSRNTDQFSDLDFFLFISVGRFSQFLQDFPSLLRHPVAPIASRQRGFLPYFGYQFTFIYPDRSIVDYFVNCNITLLVTPMARKTQVIHDLTGEFTEYHRNLPGPAEGRAAHLADAAAEILTELIRIKKYVGRNDLPPVIHRLERLRLVALALERYLHHAQPYIPHDADKWVLRDLGPGPYETLRPTFARLSLPDIDRALRQLTDFTLGLMRELDDRADISDRLWRMYTELANEIHTSLRQLSS